jgi:SulP family sulfate permease
VPRPVLAGFLLSRGLALLWEWRVASRARPPPGDRLLFLTMLAVAAIFGFAFSVLVGIVASCIAFAVSYSRAGVVQHELDGHGIHSRVMRPADHRDVLARRGAALHVMILRGVIFFGTAHSLLARVRPFLEGKDVEANTEGHRAAPGLRVLVLDFDHVAGIDSSAVMTFSKVAQLAAAHGARVFVSGAPAARLEEANAAEPRTGALQRFATLEQALDAAEEALLRDAARDPDGGRAQPRHWFTQELGGEEHWRALAPLLQCRALAAGEVLLRQGDVSDTTLYLVESGRLEVTLDGQAQGQRLACLMAGNLVGEMALYDNANRSATVRALSGSIVWALSRDALERLNATAPETALRVHAIVMRTMATRVQDANATIAALQRGA